MKRQALFPATLARRRAPYYDQGGERVKPTIMRIGTAAQKARLPTSEQRMRLFSK